MSACSLNGSRNGKARDTEHLISGILTFPVPIVSMFKTDAQVSREERPMWCKAALRPTDAGRFCY
jgi:hypothetical protein